jgi:hypothetical protein
MLTHASSSVQLTYFYTVKDGKMVQMTNRLIIALGGDGFTRSSSTPGFQATAQFLKFLALSNRSGSLFYFYLLLFKFIGCWFTYAHYSEFNIVICGVDAKEKSTQVKHWLHHIAQEVAEIERNGGLEVNGIFYEVLRK